MTLQKLREKRAQVVADMEAILDACDAEARDMDDDEKELYAAYEEDLTKVKAAIERRETLVSEKEALDAIKPAATRGQGAETPRITSPGPEAKREFSSFGEFVGAAVAHNLGRGDDPRLQFDENAGITAGPDGQNMGDGSAGGFLVPTQWRDSLLQVDPQQAIIEGRSNVMEVGTPPDAEITMSALDQSGSTDNVYGGVTMNWIGEGDTKPKTEAKFREVSLTPQELAGHIPITDKLMRNAPAMSGQLERLMRGALTGAKETAFLNGNGVAKPTGILKANCTIKIKRDTANQVKYVDLAAMLAKLLMQGGSPYWLISQSVYPQLLQLQDPNGNYIWQLNSIDGSPGSLLGYPVFWHERSPLLGVYGDVTLCNSNPYYLVKPGSGPFIAAGFIGNDFVNNQTRVKIFTNVDGKPWLTEPYTQEGGHQVSPFVALDIPAA